MSTDHAKHPDGMKLKFAASAEPVAYAAFADNGNIRIWSREPLNVPGCVPLYIVPPAAQAQSDDALDAARYRLLRRKVCIAGGEFHIRNLDPRYIGPNAAAKLDVAIDAAMRKGG